MTKLQGGPKGSIVRTLALCALAIGATAVGAFAIGDLAIGRVSVRRGRIEKLTSGELIIDRLPIKSQSPENQS